MHTKKYCMSLYTFCAIYITQNSMYICTNGVYRRKVSYNRSTRRKTDVIKKLLLIKLTPWLYVSSSFFKTSLGCFSCTSEKKKINIIYTEMGSQRNLKLKLTKTTHNKYTRYTYK